MSAPRFGRPLSARPTSPRPGAGVDASPRPAVPPAAPVLDTPVPAVTPAGRPLTDVMGEERFLRVREVAAMVGLSQSQIYALTAEGRFPAGLRIGPNYTRWLASEVRAWMADRVAEARRARRVS